MSLAEIVTDLRKGDSVPPDSSLVELSELDSGELFLLARALDGITTKRRRDMVRRLAELADGSIALNFHAVLRLCLKDPDAEVRKEAIRGLWECEEPPLIEPLISLLEEDTSEEVQAEATRALGRFALLAEHGALGPEHTPPIVRALLNAADSSTVPPEVRQRAIEAVAPLSLPEVRTAIGDTYRSRDDRLRISAVHAMGQSCDPFWLSILLQELGSADSDMRREATEALGEIEEEDTVPQLAELIYDDDVEVQLAAIRALGNIGGAEASECLKQCLDDPNEAVIGAAEEVLQGLADSEDMSSFLMEPDQMHPREA